jgi:histone deacetylase 11
LAIYNAGTDVLAEDALGGMRQSLDDVLARDRFVLRQLREHNIPTVVLTSGGYSADSYRAIVRMVLTALDRDPPV